MKRPFRSFFTVIIILFLFSYVSCLPLVKGKFSIVDFLPRETDVPGWQISRQPLQLKPDQIREQPHGAYGALSMATVRYSSLSDSNIHYNVIIVRFNSTLDAYGMFTRERERLGAATQKGFDDFCVSDRFHLSRRGRYCMIVNNPQGFKNSENAVHFLNVMDTHVRENEKSEPLPKFLSVFSDDYSRDRLVYYSGPYEELPEIKGLFVRFRKLFGKEVRVLFKKTYAGDIARDQFNYLIKLKDKGFSLLSSSPFRCAVREQDEMILCMGHFKEWLFGVAGLDSLEVARQCMDKLYAELGEYI